jgi:hypothetical protein
MQTLKGEFRGDIKPSSQYYFCATPSCPNVYFSADQSQSFQQPQLINRVTCKDPAPQTPLCYCYKITKGDALDEYQRSGSCSVLQQIEQKMHEKSCFCDRSNPRGICCTSEITAWLEDQGMMSEQSTATTCGSKPSCC